MKEHVVYQNTKFLKKYMYMYNKPETKVFHCLWIMT